MPSQLKEKRVCGDREMCAELGAAALVTTGRWNTHTFPGLSDPTRPPAALPLTYFQGISVFLPLRKLLRKASKMTFPTHSQFENQKQQKQNPVW